MWDNPLNHYDLNGRDVCAPTPFGDACAGDAAEDVASGDPRELVTAAQEYWVENESPFSYVAGSIVSMTDLAVNPDRLGDYIKDHPWGHKQILADCYSGGRTGRTIGGVVGGGAGFGIGAASGSELGPLGAAGVGTVSGTAGAGIGGSAGTIGGCAIGTIGGLVP